MDTIQFNCSFSAEMNQGNFENNTIQGGVCRAAFENDCNFGQDHIVGRAVKVLAYCVIIVLSTLGNSATIAVVSREPSLRKMAFNSFVVNLAVADLVITLVYMPRALVIWLQGTVWLVEGAFGSVLCKTVPSLHAISILVSILTLLAMAVDRFIVIVFPLREKLTLRSSKLIVASSWLLSLILRFPYTYSLRLKTDKELYCSVDVEEAFGDSQAREVYYTFLFVALYGFPFVTIVTLYSAIVITLRRGNPMLCDKNSSQIANRVLYRASRKMFCMLVVVTAAFVMCWLTYFIAQVLHDPIPCSLRFWRLVLAHINSAINPFLYAIFNLKFRHGYKRLLHSIRCSA